VANGKIQPYMQGDPLDNFGSFLEFKVDDEHTGVTMKRNSRIDKEGNGFVLITDFDKPYPARYPISSTPTPESISQQDGFDTAIRRNKKAGENKVLDAQGDNQDWGDGYREGLRALRNEDPERIKQYRQMLTDPPAQDAEWDESKHKRADNGQFGSGGGGATKSAKPAPKEAATAGGSAKSAKPEPAPESKEAEAARIAEHEKPFEIGEKTHANGQGGWSKPGWYVRRRDLEHGDYELHGPFETKDEVKAEEHRLDMAIFTDRRQKHAGPGFDRGPAFQPAGDFNAAQFAKIHDKFDVTESDVINGFPDDTAEKLRDVNARIAETTPTNVKHKDAAGNWTPERQALHAEIIQRFISPERVERAKPKDGEKPTFTVLGGRGGSGKSWFEGNVYDPETAVVLDSDEIKKMLPEYKGWNAAEVHEESGEIFDQITELAKENGVNLVHDATMKNPVKAKALVEGFKKDGYRIEAHYMHLPRQEAAKRAVDRFLGPTGRYVPPNIVLENTQNEESFEGVKDLADAWSFRDNNVARHMPPVLISESRP